MSVDYTLSRCDESVEVEYLGKDGDSNIVSHMFSVRFDSDNMTYPLYDMAEREFDFRLEANIISHKQINFVVDADMVEVYELVGAVVDVLDAIDDVISIYKDKSEVFDDVLCDRLSLSGMKE